MPAGRLHDRITFWSLPLVTGATFYLTRNGTVTLLVAGGFVFSGVMFGPDLDTRSRQYHRWGWLRWIWLPYRQALRHRSVWSHGPVVGTLGRVLYLTMWLAIAAMLVIVLGAIVAQSLGQVYEWWLLVQQVTSQSRAWMGRSLLAHRQEWLGLLIGLELGALSHILSDWSGSRLKRHRKKRRGPSRQRY